MSELHIRQIRAALEKTFGAIIDLDDTARLSPEDKTSALLTRSVAALALAHLAGIDPEDAAAAVVDGYGDNGIDAIYYHPTERVLYLVQSKWKYDGTGSVERGDVQKFIKGLKDLVNARWDRFPNKVQQRKTTLEQALNDASMRIALVLAYSGQSSLSVEVQQDLKDAVEELNDPTDLVSYQVLRQADLHSIISKGLGGAPINIDVQLYEWGQAREPFHGFYGQVAASDVAQWLAANHNRLFAPNLRVFLGATNVNASMVQTLVNAPGHFWYFNNGVTALCRRITKKPIGGNTHETGTFECEDLRVVNGAQTVGAIADAASKSPENVSKARVWLRLISLESCPDGFGKEITRFNNSQNRIERRDFVALDPEQERLAAELALEGIDYLFKSGETLADPAQGMDLAEATVARACQNSDITYTVNAKAEIGRLWEDIERAPYKVLFNSSVTGPNVWRLVQVMRRVDKVLQKLKKDPDGRRRLLAVHGNRFILHVVYRRLDPTVFTGSTALDLAAVASEASTSFDDVLSAVNTHYPEAYLANLFKNVEKCRTVAKDVLP